MDQDATNRFTGAVRGAVVQAHTVYGGIHVHAGTSTSEEGIAAPATPSSSGWAGVPALPEEVRSLLRAQVESAKDLPYRLPEAHRPSFDIVYVRQDLGSGVDESPSEQQRPAPILRQQGPTGRRTERPRSYAWPSSRRRGRCGRRWMTTVCSSPVSRPGQVDPVVAVGRDGGRAVAVRGTGSRDGQLRRLGADTVLLDTYHGDPQETRRPHEAWQTLTVVATYRRTPS